MAEAELFQVSQQKESAVDTVVNRFRELILQKKLRPGDLLPSEGALAAAMGVSRGSVREAMKVLSALGMVDVRRGDGTYVSADFGRTMLDPFLMKLMMSDTDTRQLAEFRQMIEFDVARAAACNQDREGIAEIGRAIAQMEQALAGETNLDEARWAELDLAFHRAMGRATGNVLVEQLYEFVLRFFEPSIRQIYRQQPDNGAQALLVHRTLYKAVAAGDLPAVQEAVQHSVDRWVSKGEWR